MELTNPLAMTALGGSPSGSMVIFPPSLALQAASKGRRQCSLMVLVAIHGFTSIVRERLWQYLPPKKFILCLEPRLPPPAASRSRS